MSNPRRYDFEEHVPGYDPIIYTPSETDWIETSPGEKMLIRVRSGDVGGCYAVVETVASPGSASPVHFHAEDEVYQVLSGKMLFMVGGEIVSAPAGTTVVIPALTPHGWMNRSADPVRMLVTFTPGGVEDMFEQVAGFPPQDVLKIATSFGTIVVGPPVD